MPIRPELRPLYTGPIWKATRARILDRAGHRCEECGKPDRERVETCSGTVHSLTRPDVPIMYWRAVSGSWRNQRGMRAVPVGLGLVYPGAFKLRTITVVLTIAHLNHVAGDDRDENLKALCQWCHLNYDRTHHSQTRSNRKDSRRPLLPSAELSAQGEL